MMLEMTQNRSKAINRPIGPLVETVKVNGGEISLGIDGTTQMLMREYSKGVHDGILAVWNLPDNMIAFLKQQNRELRDEMMIQELRERGNGNE